MFRPAHLPISIAASLFRLPGSASRIKARAQVLGGSQHDPQLATTGAKRAAPVPTAQDDAAVATKLPWKRLADSGKVQSKTVDVLRQYLRHFGLNTSGRKAELVDRVVAHINR